MQLINILERVEIERTPYRSYGFCKEDFSLNPLEPSLARRNTKGLGAVRLPANVIVISTEKRYVTFTDRSMTVDLPDVIVVKVSDKGFGLGYRTDNVASLIQYAGHESPLVLTCKDLPRGAMFKLPKLSSKEAVEAVNDPENPLWDLPQWEEEVREQCSSQFTNYPNFLFWNGSVIAYWDKWLDVKCVFANPGVYDNCMVAHLVKEKLLMHTILVERAWKGVFRRNEPKNVEAYALRGDEPVIPDILRYYDVCKTPLPEELEHLKRVSL